MSDPNDYTVGWICAITPEYVAARAFLDEEHKPPAYLPPRNSNHYILGRVGKHNVVIAVLPMGSYGIASAARVAENMLHSFPSVRFGLMVGIGGGVPSQKHDIRLGDIVVSIPSDGKGGVLQYDYGESIQNQDFRITSVLDQPPTILRAAVNGLQAEYEMEGHELDASVDSALQKWPRLRKKYQKPEQNTDQLYQSKALHSSTTQSCESCANDPSMLISRLPRDEYELNPAIHYGLIASADRLMSDAILRDQLSAENDILCFETEAAGLMNGFPCLVVRGICDYSDSHKGERWHGYSSMVASAYSRDLLYRIPPQQVMAEARIVETLKPILTQVVETAERIEISIEFDRLPAVRDAQFDSYINQHEEFCLPGTRTGVIDGISQWVHSPTGKPIFWLNGMAGTGKSTITRTLARHLKESNMLGASFFFKRGESNRGGMQWLLPTIAKQLAQVVPELRPSILNAVRDDPDISTKGLPEQFERLILQPLLSVTDGYHSSHVVIVIDALDECETQNDVAILLRLLPRVRQSKKIITRVFLTSRPEIIIRLGFSEIGNDSQDLILHQIPEEVTEQDITLFLRHQMASIRRERLLPADWPSEEDLFALVRLSVPLFIFAATMCRLFQDYQSDPVVCLAEILANGSEGSQLHGTYLPVLNLISNTKVKMERVAEEFRVVVGAIILLESALSIPSLSKLINVPESGVDIRLNSLHSVIRIPREREMPLHLFHLSFRDFLLHPETKEKSLLWIDEKDGHYRLALNCLSLCQKLKKNMCSLPSDGTLRTEINQQILDKVFPPELKYSCTFWAHHVTKSDDIMSLAQEIFQFLREHFLHWLEAMNLLGLGSEAISIIQQLKPKMIENSEVYDFLCEGERFAVKNQYIADEAPLQLYSSCLVFAPKKSMIRDFYRHEVPQWINHLPEVNESWDVGLRQLEGDKAGHLEGRRHLAFSHDGQMIASCGERHGFSSDSLQLQHTIRVWHIATGVVQQTLGIQSSCSHGRVSSVTFARNGQLLACRFSDGGIAICDLVQRAVINAHPPLVSPATSLLYTSTTRKEAMSGVSSISSHDWKIAYSEVGEAIEVWSLLTSEKTHQSPFNNIGPLTISSDGRLVASCLFYNVHKARSSVPRLSLKHKFERWTRENYKPERRAGIITALRIWNTVDNTTEVMDSPFSHVNSVWHHSSCPDDSDYYDPGYWPCLTFSPNNQLLAVDSNLSIQLWDVPNKTLKWNLMGHSDLLAFSFDGTLLASSTHYDTIRVWNLVSGTLQHVLRDFGGLISLTFSPKEYLLATSSTLGGIQLRDLGMISEADSNVLNCLNHGNQEHQVIFHPSEFPGSSPPSRSSISDHSTKDPQASSLLIPGRIRLVTVSPDCRLLATSGDCTNGDSKVQLWDISEGRYLRGCELYLPSNKSRSIAISHRNEFMAVSHWSFGAGQVSDIKIVEIATGEHRHSIQPHGGVCFLSFSPDDRFLFFAHDDWTFSLWDMAQCSMTHIEGVPIAMPRYERRWAIVPRPSVAFSRSGLLAYTGLMENGRLFIHLCETISGLTRHLVKSQSSKLQSLCFSPDGQWLAAATSDKKIYVWNVNTGLLRHNFDEKEYINTLQFTADSSTLISHLEPFDPQDSFALFRNPRSDRNIDIPLPGEWIRHRDENILWLPSEFRPNFDMLVVKNTLIMSHSTGKLSFIGFDFTHLHGPLVDVEVRRDLRDIEKQLEAASAGDNQGEEMEGMSMEGD